MRLFIAAAFPEALLRPLNERVAALRPKLPAASWVRPETQHLTFAFLGEQPETLIDTLSPMLTSAVAGEKKFDATLRGCGFFPNSRHARVGWVGLEPHDEFAAIAERVREVVQKAGVALDGGDFRPHLTLMRIRDRWPPASIATFQKGLGSYESEKFPVESITLYSSKLNPNGAVHTPLKQFLLAG